MAPPMIRGAEGAGASISLYVSERMRQMKAKKITKYIRISV